MYDFDNALGISTNYLEKWSAKFHQTYNMAEFLNYIKPDFKPEISRINSTVKI